MGSRWMAQERRGVTEARGAAVPFVHTLGMGWQGPVTHGDEPLDQRGQELAQGGEGCAW